MTKPLLPVLLASAALAGCMVGPNYHRPTAPVSPTYKEAAGWVPAQPSDAADRRDWWTVLNDPVLNELEQRVDISNQNLAAAEAAWRQSEALVREQRAALFPTVTYNGSAEASGGGGGGGTVTPGGTVTGGRGTTTSYRVGLGASWAPDLWGRIRRTVEAARAGAQASAADLANARLSAQTTLALDYIQLRQLDEQKRLSDATVVAYGRSLTVTQNRYNAGVAARSDVLSAQTQLANAKADDADLEQQRARLEHAIAILTGRPPAELTLTSAPWTLVPPQIPAGVPSTLLQRRPDIAAAERRAAQANAQIGVAKSAYYPDLTLTGSGGFASSELGNLFSASSTLWSVGAQLAGTLFDAGARGARVSQARAAYDQQVALYRQAVLNGLGEVEDNLAAQRVLAAEQALRDQSLAAARENERILLNQYNAGQVDYTAVVVAQTAAYGAERAALQNQASRLAAAVDLIAALGGGWTTGELDHPIRTPQPAG
ncbi:MAG TPA: efflux transporter outer membrane subunit [Caulobacteraceae bacterium]|nr:efflux transporter outer membrane subunit [Caulobacteraceae bacterium]